MIYVNETSYDFDEKPKWNDIVSKQVTDKPVLYDTNVFYFFLSSTFHTMSICTLQHDITGGIQRKYQSFSSGLNSFKFIYQSDRV